VASESSKSGSFSGRLNTAYWLLLVVLLSLPLISPLLRWSAVPCTHDGHLHYHRIAALRYAWENGTFFTRWLPDLAFGYGYPFFVYREAPPLYIPFLPHLLGMPLPAASNLFYALTIIAAGVFMFLWARDVLGERPALVSSVAYMAAPYVLVDALVRGNSPESLALPLLPLILWAGRRWVLFGSVWSFVSGVLGLALLSLSHNISTFIFAPTLLVYLLALVWLRPIAAGRSLRAPNNMDEDQLTLAPRRQPRALALLRVVLLVGLGLGLAFFYTGGALLEMNQVTLEMSTTTRNNDWRFNFASLGEILGPVAPEDAALVNPPLLFRLGWVPLALALGGLTGLWWIKGQDVRSREQRLHIGLMAIGALLYLFMALPVSRFVWEALPLIDFVQFPWRFVGRAALPMAFLAGVPVVWFDRGRQTVDRTYQRRFDGWWPVVLTAAAISLLILETLPNLYPRYCPEEPFPTILTVHAYERGTGLVGVDPEGSYFPRTVRERPSESPLEAGYAAGTTPQRFDLSALPDGATASQVDYDGLGVNLMIDTPQPFTARYLSFAFPGWTARVNGEAVRIIPEDPSGLITFRIPAGSHEVTVDWGATPLRLVLVALSLLSAIGVAAVIVWAGKHPQDTDREQPVRANYRELGVLILVGVALLGLKLVNDRLETPLRGIGSPPLGIMTDFQGGEMRLDGFNLSRETVTAGEAFDIHMGWTAVDAPLVDYQSEVWLEGPDGLIWSEKGTERPRVYETAAPTRLWTAGEWGWDSREVRTLTGTPPGLYNIVMTFFDRDTLAPVTLTKPATGQVAGPTAVIGQIEVTNPATSPEFTPHYLTHADYEPGVWLIGFNQDRLEAAPGESVLLTFFWECEDGGDCEQFNLTLRDEQGVVIEEWDLPLIRESFAKESWPDHGLLRGQHLLRLPAGLSSGRYHFEMEWFPLGEIVVTAPERQLSPPSLITEANALFTTDDGEPIATLAGLSAGTSSLPVCTSTTDFQPGQLCSLPLVWRAEAESPVSYHVFVHLVNESGDLIAQSDAIPGNWARPTTGWLPGEYILDNHTLNVPDLLPDGPLRLRIGLYDPENGQRLSTNGTEFTEVEVGGES
jgi:hypothetical protein